jgi:hypothetical protein
MKNIAFVLALLLIFSGLAISSMIQKSGTCDEIAHHIAVGYSYFKTFDFRLNPYNPPLPRYLIAFPLNFMNLKASFEGKDWQEADAPGFSRQFFFEYNRDKFREILFFSRLMIVFTGIFAAFLVYKTASIFYGAERVVCAFHLLFYPGDYSAFKFSNDRHDFYLFFPTCDFFLLALFKKSRAKKCFTRIALSGARPAYKIYRAFALPGILPFSHY